MRFSGAGFSKSTHTVASDASNGQCCTVKSGPNEWGVSGEIVGGCGVTLDAQMPNKIKRATSPASKYKARTATAKTAEPATHLDLFFQDAPRHER